MTNEKSIGLNHDPPKAFSATVLNAFLLKWDQIWQKKSIITLKYEAYHRIKKSRFQSKTDKVEVFNELKRMNNKKSLDTFRLSIFFQKTVSPTISEELSRIFNKCIEEDCFPNLLKIGKMIPIHKEGPKIDAGNHRPIS